MLPDEKSPETIRVAGVRFRGEQDGAPERTLKQGLTALFQSRSDVQSAYLAVVAYDRALGLDVALCILGVTDSDRPALAQAIGNVFAGIFGASQHLDILFPSDTQKAQLEQVCRPFFVRGTPPTKA